MDEAPAIVLTDLQLDALTELVNLGVSNAATNLSEMIREEVALSVPRVAVVTREAAIATFKERDMKRLVGVRQDFDGAIHGRALLIFPETKSIELVRAVVGGEPSLEDIVELEQEALAETGNILLNSCLSTIANSLELSLRISLPEVVHGEGSEFFEITPTPAGANVLFIYINFDVRQRSISGFIAMLLDLPSSETLRKFLSAFIERTAG